MGNAGDQIGQAWGRIGGSNSSEIRHQLLPFLQPNLILLRSLVLPADLTEPITTLRTVRVRIFGLTDTNDLNKTPFGCAWSIGEPAALSNR